MRFVRLAAVAAMLAAGCGPHAASNGTSTSPAPAASTPGLPAAATPVPIRIETHGGDGQYVTIVQTIRGRKAYTIRALSSNVQRAGTNEGTGEFEQPHITFVGKDGSTTIADAPKAHLAERDKTVVMTGGVHARTSNGSVLSCDTLTYRESTERFHGEGNVQLMARDGLHLEGQHLDGDTRLQDVTVTGGASP